MLLKDVKLKRKRLIVTLSALIVKDLVVILVGRTVAGDSLLKATKDIAEILNTSLNAE